jgi:uncharacterized protein involved in propanediol utilization
VETEDLALYDGRQGQIIEKLSECFPDIGIAVLAEALVVESVATLAIKGTMGLTLV